MNKIVTSKRNKIKIVPLLDKPVVNIRSFLIQICTLFSYLQHPSLRTTRMAVCEVYRLPRPSRNQAHTVIWDSRKELLSGWQPWTMPKTTRVRHQASPHKPNKYFNRFTFQFSTFRRLSQLTGQHFWRWWVASEYVQFPSKTRSVWQFHVYDRGISLTVVCWQRVSDSLVFNWKKTQFKPQTPVTYSLSQSVCVCWSVSWSRHSNDIWLHWFCCILRPSQCPLSSVHCPLPTVHYLPDHYHGVQFNLLHWCCKHGNQFDNHTQMENTWLGQFAVGRKRENVTDVRLHLYLRFQGVFITFIQVGRLYQMKQVLCSFLRSNSNFRGFLLVILRVRIAERPSYYLFTIRSCDDWGSIRLSLPCRRF